MDRETRIIELPISKKKVGIITYFTRGERMEIEKLLLSNSKMSMKDGKQELDFDPIASIEQREKTISIAVKTIDEVTATMQMINDLHEEDGTFIEEEINKLGADKKKPTKASEK